MKVVILCGGQGTRLGELTGNVIPKPMVKIGDFPILVHIMRHYRHYGHREFILCAGHLSWAIKDYFINYYQTNDDIKIDLMQGAIRTLRQRRSDDWLITIAETGASTMTAGRVKKVLDYLDDDESFMLTYGDGLSNVNINNLIDFHNNHGKGVTLTGVIPPGRFGELDLQNNQVFHWAEKPIVTDRYINGGFMVMRKKFADRIISNCEDDVMLEREPFEQAAKEGEMMVYRHDGFWQCMDTMRDWDMLNKIWSNGKAPWTFG